MRDLVKRLFKHILRFLELDKPVKPEAGNIRLHGWDEDLYVPAFVNKAKERRY